MQHPAHCIAVGFNAQPRSQIRPCRCCPSKRHRWPPPSWMSPSPLPLTTPSPRPLPAGASCVSGQASADQRLAGPPLVPRPTSVRSPGRTVPCGGVRPPDRPHHLGPPHLLVHSRGLDRGGGRGSGPAPRYLRAPASAPPCDSTRRCTRRARRQVWCPIHTCRGWWVYAVFPCHIVFPSISLVDGGPLSSMLCHPPPTVVPPSRYPFRVSYLIFHPHPLHPRLFHAASSSCPCHLLTAVTRCYAFRRVHRIQVPRFACPTSSFTPTRQRRRSCG
jgi:hypothetical protein